MFTIATRPTETEVRKRLRTGGTPCTSEMTPMTATSDIRGAAATAKARTSQVFGTTGPWISCGLAATMRAATVVAMAVAEALNTTFTTE